MIGRKKKEALPQRNPHIGKAKQSVFHYSSNRTQSERQYNRGEMPSEDSGGTKSGFSLLNKASFVASAVVLTGAAIYCSLLLSPPTVIITSGQPLRDNAPYNDSAKNIASSSVFSRSKLTLNREKISEEMQTKFPEIAEADVSTPVFSPRMTIKLKLADATAILDTGNGDYLLDNRGVALFNINETLLAIDRDELVRIDDPSDARIEPGKPALTSGQMAFAREIKHQSDAKKIEIESLELVAGGGELAVKYSGTPYIVKYNTNEDPRKSFGTYFSTREYLIGKRITPAEYVDVRIPERAYTK